MIMKRHARSKGFTLVELLIVVAIVLVLGGSALEVQSRLRESRERMIDRMNAADSASRTVRQWRTDVAAATRVDLVDESRTMRIWIADEDGSEMVVRYFLSVDAALVRLIEGPDARPEVLCPSSRALRFESIGRGFAMRWNVDWEDGIRRWSVEKGGYATPLTQ